MPVATGHVWTEAGRLIVRVGWSWSSPPPMACALPLMVTAALVSSFLILSGFAVGYIWSSGAAAPDTMAADG